MVQHKRSTRSLSDEEKIPREIARMLKGEPAVRKKRFGVRFEVFELSEDDNVIYSGKYANHSSSTIIYEYCKAVNRRASVRLHSF